MFGLSQKELNDISLSEQSTEVQINTEKFCRTAEDIKVGLAAAKILVKNPLVKLLISLAETVVASLQARLNCPK